MTSIRPVMMAVASRGKSGSAYIMLRLSVWIIADGALPYL